MSLPDPSKTYYLRSAFNGNDLIPNGNDYYITSPRPVSSSPNQLHFWRFVQQAQNLYYIQNVGTGQYLKIGTYGNSYNGWYNVVVSQTPSDTWFVQINGPTIQITWSGGSYTLHIEATYIYAIGPNYTYSMNEPLRKQWYLDDIGGQPQQPLSGPIVNKNPLPKGVYRIRSFSGGYLLTMPASAQGQSTYPYVSKQDPKNDAQKWLVTPVANSSGLYTIANSGTGLYLAGSKTNLVEGATLAGQSFADEGSASKWSIQTFGDGVFFFMGLPGAQLSIGFPSYHVDEDSAVTLETSDNIPSQIWFFETYKQLSSAIFHGKRQLNGGSYTIELCHDNNYLKVAESEDAFSTTSARSSATQLLLTYVNSENANFVLSFSSSDGKMYLYADGDRLRLSEDRKTEWMLVALEQDSKIAFHICMARSEGDDRKALSSRTIKDGRKFLFAIDDLAEHEVMQLWRFHEI